MAYKVRARWTDEGGNEHVAVLDVHPPGPTTDRDVLDYVLLFLMEEPGGVGPPGVPELEIVVRPQPETQ